MTTELAVREDGEVVEHRAPMTLFGTDNPSAVVERASAVATALGDVINERRLFASISGKKHVQVEGWTLLGSMLGVFAEVEWSRPLENGWEARAVARTLNGNVVGAAEAMCTTNEGRWRSADTYAVRSMAQTRAVSKALRMPLGFIMHLAGYSATPAEEVPEESQPERGERAPASGGAGTKPATTSAPARNNAPRNKGEAAEMLLAIARERSPKKPLEWLEAQARDHNIKRGEATLEELTILLTSLRSPEPTTTEVAHGGQAASEEAAGPSVPAEAPSSDGSPPKPGTPEYGALTPSEKATARAYWAEHTEDEQQTLAEQLSGSAA